MRGQIFWAIALGFCAGVFARSFFAIDIEIVIGIATIAIATSIISLFRPTFSYGVIFAIACVFFGVGAIRMNAAVASLDPNLSQYVGKTVVLEGVVSDEPDPRESSVRISIDARNMILATTTIPISAGVLALAPAHTEVKYGDRLRVEGTLRLPESFEVTDGREFNYPHFLAAKGITFELAFAKVEKISDGEGNVLKYGALRVKQTFLSGLTNALPEPAAGLAGGITVGDKRSIGPELSEVFKQVSLAHIIVLSGYNITIVMRGISSGLSYLPLIVPRSVHFGIAGFIALFFVLMTGGAASAARAGAMALIAVYARMSGREFLALRVLALVALAMVLWNPLILAFDPGFQLSVLATVGLIIFSPIVERYLRWIPRVWGLREIAAATIGTQIAVLPLLLFQNGQLSLVALPANLLALLPIPFAMLLTLIAAIGGTFLGPLAPIVGFPAYLLLSYIIKVAEVLASFSFASISVPAFSALWLFVAYGVLFVTATLVRRSEL